MAKVKLCVLIGGARTIHARTAHARVVVARAPWVLARASRVLAQGASSAVAHPSCGAPVGPGLGRSLPPCGPGPPLAPKMKRHAKRAEALLAEPMRMVQCFSPCRRLSGFGGFAASSGGSNLSGTARLCATCLMSGAPWAAPARLARRTIVAFAQLVLVLLASDNVRAGLHIKLVAHFRLVLAAVGRFCATRVAGSLDSSKSYFIRTMPHGYDAMFDNEGSSFSQGQRQLLAIAPVGLPPLERGEPDGRPGRRGRRGSRRCVPGVPR